MPERIGVLRTEPVAEGVAIASELRWPRFDPYISRIGMEAKVVAAEGILLAVGLRGDHRLGAVAGMMVAPVVFLEPNMMSGVLLYAFAGALLGGIDSPGGAVLGGFIVGILENVVGLYLGAELKLTAALLVIVAVLLLRPAGLFGRPSIARV